MKNTVLIFLIVGNVLKNQSRVHEPFPPKKKEFKDTTNYPTFDIQQGSTIIV